MRTKEQLTSLERAHRSAALALEKKALNVRIYEIGKLSSIADYLVLANGRSDKQVQAIADSVKKGLKKFGKPLDVEGAREGNWIIVDYGDVIVHVFHEEMRDYYKLDELWTRAPEVELPADYVLEPDEE